MKDKKQKILILFEGQWLAYSPTVLQLHDALSKYYDITIFAEKPPYDSALNNNIYYFKYELRIKRFFFKGIFLLMTFFIPLLKNFKYTNNNYQDYFFRFLEIKKIIKNNQYEKVICVDIKNLLFCSLLNIKCDFLSLEICINENLLPLTNTNIIDTVIIQRLDRYDYLFKGKKKKIFLVQNAPIYRDINQEYKRKGLIFSGTVSKEFGIFYCLDFLIYDKNETMLIMGAINEKMSAKIEIYYPKLLSSNRLIINKEYLDNEEVVNYLSKFEIGFCLYNFDTSWVQNFNYETAPSGKVFKYLAAGVPVICNDIIGFDFVRFFGCGELILDMSPINIAHTISLIRNDYDNYVKKAILAAKYFSFDKAVQPYIDYLQQTKH